MGVGRGVWVWRLTSNISFFVGGWQNRFRNIYCFQFDISRVLFVWRSTCHTNGCQGSDSDMALCRGDLLLVEGRPMILRNGLFTNQLGGGSFEGARVVKIKDGKWVPEFPKEVGWHVWPERRRDSETEIQRDRETERLRDSETER